MNPTTYSVRFRISSTGAVHERAFETLLLRLMFVVGFEGNGFGKVLAEWTS